MPKDEALANALMSLAEAEGVDPAQLLQQMLRARIGGAAPALPAHQPQPAPQQFAPPPQPQVIDRTPAPHQPRSESDMAAQAKWLAAESQPTGVLGDAGMTGGGVFGHGVVASEGWDPAAHHRQVALERAAPALGAPTTAQLAAHLAAQLQAPPRQLPPQEQQVRYYQTTTMYEGPANRMPPPPVHPQFAQQQPRPHYPPQARPQHPQLAPAPYPMRQLPPRRR